MMTEVKLNQALQILGPKIVNSILRMAKGKLHIFESQVDCLMESKKNKNKEWFIIESNNEYD